MIAIVLNGASSAGKTSIALALQRAWGGPLLYVALDTFTDMLDWSTIREGERAACHGAAVANFHRCLPVLAECSLPMVVDHVLEQPAWAEACASGLSSRSVIWVGVRCSLSTLELRERARGDRRLGLAAFQDERVHLHRGYDLEVDTDALSPDECARVILEFLGRESP